MRLHFPFWGWIIVGILVGAAAVYGLVIYGITHLFTARARRAIRNSRLKK